MKCVITLILTILVCCTCNPVVNEEDLSVDRRAACVFTNCLSSPRLTYMCPGGLRISNVADASKFDCTDVCMDCSKITNSTIIYTNLKYVVTLVSCKAVGRSPPNVRAATVNGCIYDLCGYC